MQTFVLLKDNEDLIFLKYVNHKGNAFSNLRYFQKK